MRRSRSWIPTFLQSFLVATKLPRICLAQNGAQVVTASSTPSVQPSTTTSAPAQTHTIQVGLADHKFKPETTVANIGDTIEFAFYPRNHSVVRAEYGFPCIPYEMTGSSRAGFFSGFQPVDKVLPSPPTYRIVVNDTNPIFFYCSAPGSCLTYGMVGAINPNASTILEEQQRLALNSSYMLNPGEPFPAETPSPSHPPSSTTTSSPSTGKTNDNRSSLSKRAIIAMVVTSACITILAAILFFFWGRTKGLKDELKRKATTIWRPDTHPTGHVRNMSMMIPRAELGAIEPNTAMHHQPYYYQYPHQASPPTDDATAYQHQHQQYPPHAAFSPAQTMSLCYPPPPPSSPSPLHMHPTKSSIASPLDPHPAYSQHQLHHHQQQLQQHRTALQSPVRHELDSQQQTQDASGDAELATTTDTPVNTTAAVEQDTKSAAHQVREVQVNTTAMTPTPTPRGEDADADEIEPVPSYFDAVFAGSRAVNGGGRKEGEGGRD